MALMPPRRSARLSSDDHFHNNNSNYDQPNTTNLIRGTGKGNSSGTSRQHGRSSLTNSGAAAGSSRTTIQELQRKERRWEDINESDDEDGGEGGGGSANKDDSNDFMLGFTRPIITGNAKHAASIPVQRQPRTTFHEQEDDDGFIFTSVNPSNSVGIGKGKEKATMISGSKGAPPRQSTSRIGEERISSGPVKAVRRVSLLRDGSAAVPHPIIADTDLHRHCSSDLDPRQRLQHLAIWTLDRSFTKIMKTYSAPSSSRQTIDNVVQKTIESLTQNTLLLDWPGRRKMMDERNNKSTKNEVGKKSLKPHHRNEANRKTESNLQRRIEEMESEMMAWKEAEVEIESIENEIRSLENELSSVASSSSDMMKPESMEINKYLFSKDVDENDEEFQQLSQSIRKAFSNSAIWLQSSDSSSKITSSPIEEEFIRLSKDLFTLQNGEKLPPKPIKRRRTTSVRDSIEDQNEVQDPLSISTHLQGSENDPRLNDLEWNIDLLRSRVHSYSQLAKLADRYTTAVSARGAQAIGELIGNEDRIDKHHVGLPSSGGGGGEESGGQIGSSSSNKSKISREGQQTLQRILSGIRKIESGIHEGDTADGDQHQIVSNPSNEKQSQVAGDISDGDILRAFAGISRRQR